MRHSSAAIALAAIVFVAGCTSESTAPAQLMLKPSFLSATAGCTFTTLGTTMRLDADCTTSTSIMIPDGFTLDGAHHTITAVDPGNGFFFQSAILRNEGASAHVIFVDIRAAELGITCKAGNYRLRGILFDGASGSITNSSVVGVNRGPSGCDEGNAIEVRNVGANATISTVEIAHNTVSDYQKGGIVCNGAVNCNVHHNDVGASATQSNLAANSVQYGFGATGNMFSNKVAGNSWCGNSEWGASAVLLFQPSAGLVVESNRIDGNSDVGIWAIGDGMVIAKNTVADVGDDCSAQLEDYGIVDDGAQYPLASNTLVKNQVSGFSVPYDPTSLGGKNKVKKVRPSP